MTATARRAPVRLEGTRPKARLLTMFRVPIITYHSIDDSGSVISTSPAVFQRQIATLGNAGYHAFTLRELVSRIEQDVPIPARSVVLTFDDGFKNFYTEAFPVLDAYRFAATVFLVTDHCGSYNDWPGNPADFPRTELLTWKEIRELSTEGVEFGSHTRTHPDLVSFSISATEDEIAGSKAALDDALGIETASFAYPFGRKNELTKRIAATNFKSAVSTVLGKVTSHSDLYALERVDAYYLSNPWILDRLDTEGFDRYLSVRQFLRDAKSFTAGRH